MQLVVTPLVQAEFRRAPVRQGFSLIEVMIATTVLALGIGAAVGQISMLNGVRRDTGGEQEAQALLGQLSERVASANLPSLRTSSLAWSYARPLPYADGTWPVNSVWAAPEPEWVRPLNNNPADTATGNNLVKQGLIKSGSVLKNPQVFIEYYRAMSWLDRTSLSPDSTVYQRGQWPGVQIDPMNKDSSGNGRPMYGLLCEANPFKPTTVAMFNAIMAAKDTREVYYLRATPAAAIVGIDANGTDHGNDSVLVRITLTWGGELLDMTSSGACSATMPGWKTGRRLEIWTGIR